MLQQKVGDEMISRGTRHPHDYVIIQSFNLHSLSDCNQESFLCPTLLSEWCPADGNGDSGFPPGFQGISCSPFSEGSLQQP